PGEGFAEGGGAVRGGVTRLVGGRACERCAHDGGNRVDGRADRQVDDAAGVRRREGLVLGERVPGEIGKRELPHSSCCCGGRLSAGSTSRSTLPTFDAPPGEPSSSKKSTLALV